MPKFKPTKLMNYSLYWYNRSFSKFQDDLFRTLWINSAIGVRIEHNPRLLVVLFNTDNHSTCPYINITKYFILLFQLWDQDQDLLSIPIVSIKRYLYWNLMNYKLILWSVWKIDTIFVWLVQTYDYIYKYWYNQLCYQFMIQTNNHISQ